MIHELLSSATSCLAASVAIDRDPARMCGNRKSVVTKKLIKFLPEIVRQIALQGLISDQLPSRHKELHPLSFGEESIVWLATNADGRETVWKVDRHFATPNTISNYREGESIARGYFGDLVEDTQYLIIEQPYRLGGAAVARVQNHVEISCGLFDASQEQLALLDSTTIGILRDGFRSALSNQQIPDCVGKNNVVISADNQVHFLDTTHAKYPADQPWERTVTLVNTLLESLDTISQAQSLASSS